MARRATHAAPTPKAPLGTSMPLGYLLIATIILPLAAALLTSCDTAKGRAQADAITLEAQVEAQATRQALEIKKESDHLQTQEDRETLPQRIQNRRMREWWLNILLIVFVAGLAALALGWLVGETHARRTRVLNQAHTYQPNPQTGSLPVVRVDQAPSRLTQWLHITAPLIRIVAPGFQTPSLHSTTLLVNLDEGTTLEIHQVVDHLGRAHIWHEMCLGPPGQRALAHHTRRTIILGQAMTTMKQQHFSATDIAQAVPQLGHMPVFEPNNGDEPHESVLVRPGNGNRQS